MVAAGYGFTAPTSFANPAVTLARGPTHSFSDIAPGDVPTCILAQLAGVFSARAFRNRQDQSAKLPAAWISGRQRATSAARNCR